MLELFQRVVTLAWRGSGARCAELPILGSRVWYAEFRPDRSRFAAPRRAAPRRRLPTVVLFHGLGASSTSFFPVIPHLRRAYRVVVPDLPGNGSSRLPPGRDHLGFAELVDVAERFVARVAPRGAYLAGNSMGDRKSVV